MMKVVSSPSVRLLNLDGANGERWVGEDLPVLESLFASVIVGGGEADVLFVYATLTPEGAVVGSEKSLRQLIQESGAKVSFVASPNPGEAYIRADKGSTIGRANFVMVLDRKGDAFPRFVDRLFSGMFQGKSMAAVWVEIQSCSLNSALPDSIFACELGDLTFRKGFFTKRG